MKKRIRDSLLKSGIVITETQSEKIEKYYFYLKEWNRKINLISRKNFDENFINLVEISAFSFMRFFERKNNRYKIIDIGSGAGFPSVIWKILGEDLHFLLIEPSKRYFFLDKIRGVMKFKNFTPLKKSFKEAFYFIKKEKKVYDYISCWGLKEKERMLKDVKKIVKIGILYITGESEMEKLRTLSLRAKMNFCSTKIPWKSKLYLVSLLNVPCGTGVKKWA